MREMMKTNIPWLPELADDFGIGYVKQYFYVSKDLSYEGEPERVLKLARAGIVEKDVTTNEGQMAASYEGYNKVQIGDLLLNPMDLYSGANCNVAEMNGVISPAYSNLRAKKNGTVVPKYYDYYFKTQYWLMAMFAHGKGVSFDNRWTLNNDSLRAYEIPVLPYNLQKKIVDAIQTEEMKVDALVANVQTQIEKLKAYKQSMITEAVTKGLNANVPMKDSGVDWIGMVPRHWDVVKARRIVTSTQNGLTRRDLTESKGQIVLKLKNISSDGLIDYSYINRIELTDKELQTYALSEGDFLFVRVNGSKNLVGKCAIYSDTGEIVAYNDHIIRVRINDYCSKEFFYYYLNSMAGKTEIEHHTSTSAGQYTISGEGLRDLWAVIPPPDEQNTIVEVLNSKCATIDRLISIKQKKIEKLEQYKKSLIYEYVTGKKEVQ